jgi:hypothetical protein
MTNDAENTTTTRRAMPWWGWIGVGFAALGVIGAVLAAPMFGVAPLFIGLVLMGFAAAFPKRAQDSSNLT